jgi:predicted cation transporter
MIIGLFIILGLVLILPFSVKKIEEELELFLFVMGIIAVTITSQWAKELVHEALSAPISITIAVLLAGFAFKFLQKSLDRYLGRIVKFMGIRFFVFILVAGL